MIGLEKSKLFHSLNDAELRLLKDAAEERTFAPDQVVFKEGDPGDGLFVVKSGVVVVYAVISQGEKKPFAKVGPGDFFGEMAVLDNEPRSATVATEEESVLYFIPREKLLGMLEASPRLAVALVREFSLRMRDFNRKFLTEVVQAERLTLVGRFARSIVHDFKNPLNIIGLAAELVKSETAPAASRANAAERIRKQVDRLSNMISELLEFSNGSQNPVVLGQRDYGQYVSHIIEELSPDANQRRVTIECENEPPSVGLLIDPKRLMRVFSNLINNAMEAMPDGGKVILRFEVNPKEVITEIEDTGKGFAPEILPHLFEPFATFGKAHGTGLGLSICKRIVEDHRGWIKRRSEPGHGAIFVFGLPLASPK